MKATPTSVWDCIAKLNGHQSFTTKQLIQKFTLEPATTVSPILSRFYRLGVLDQAGRSGRSMLWKSTEKQWRPTLKIIRDSYMASTSGAISRKRKSSVSKEALTLNGAIHVRIDIRTQKFAVLDDVREWLASCEGVDYTMELLK